MDICNQSIVVASLKDLLHLGVVYWNLILQLLRTNEQFKNDIRETIVIDPSDLQNIVFNSFSCYLNSKQLSSGSGINDTLLGVVEQWLHTNGYNDTASDNGVINTNDCDFNRCDSLLLSDQHKGIFDIQYDIEYTNIMNTFYINGATFNHRSHTNFTNENRFIDSVILNECDSVRDFKKTVQSEHIIVSGVKKITNFLTNNVFDHFFVSSNIDETRSEPEKPESDRDTDYSGYMKDYDTAEANSLFLQLFEITAGVMILTNWERSSSGE